MWKNIVETDRPQMTIWRMRIACWITKATGTHSEYVILISFHGNNGYANAPHCYVISILPVLFLSPQPCFCSVSCLHDRYRVFLPSRCSWILKLTNYPHVKNAQKYIFTFCLRQVAWMFDAVFVEVFDLAKVRCADCNRRSINTCPW